MLFTKDSLKDAEKIAFKQINPESVEIYRPAKQRRRENQHVIGDKPLRNNNVPGC